MAGLMSSFGRLAVTAVSYAFWTIAHLRLLLLVGIGRRGLAVASRLRSLG